MPAPINVYTGNAVSRAQIVRIGPPPAEQMSGDFEFTIGDKSLIVEGWDPAAIAAAWNALTIPEFAEIAASVGDADVYTDPPLILTGPDDGTPFDVAVSAGGFVSVDQIAVTAHVATTQQGRAPVSERQLLTIPNAASGSLTLGFDGQTTGSISFQHTAALIEAALNALSNVGDGDVTVSGVDGGPYTVEFGGTLSGIDVTLITINDAGLDYDLAGTATVETIKDGSAAEPRIEVLTISSGGFTSYRLTSADGAVDVPVYVNDPIGGTTTAAELQTAIAAAYPGTEVLNPVSGEFQILLPQGRIYETFGFFQPTALRIAVEVDAALAAMTSTATKTQSGVDGKSEVQSLFLLSAESGTFTLTYDGQTTAAITFNPNDREDNANNIQNALNALSNLDTSSLTTIDDVSVSPDLDNTAQYKVRFPVAASGSDRPLLTIDDAAMIYGTGGHSLIEESQKGVGYVPRKDTLVFTGDGTDTYRIVPRGDTVYVNHPTEGTTTAAELNIDDDPRTVVTSTIPGEFLVERPGSGHQDFVITPQTPSTTDVVRQTGGSQPDDELQRITLSPDFDGIWTISIDGETTDIIEGGAVEFALEALGEVVGNVTVNTSIDGAGNTVYDVRLPDRDWPEMTINRFDDQQPEVIEIRAAVSGLVESQRVTVTPPDGLGGVTWALSAGGQTTTAIDFNADATTVETALEALDDIANVTVLKPAVGIWDVLYSGEVDRPSLQVSASDAWLITLSDAVIGGTFALSLEGQATAAIDFNADAATVQAALEAIVGAGNAVAILADLPGVGRAWKVTLSVGLDSAMSADGAGLVMSTASLMAVDQAPAGPTHFNDPLNWLLVRSPESGDEVWLDQAGFDVIHSLRQRCGINLKSGDANTLLSDGQMHFAEGQKVTLRTDGTLPGGLAAQDYYVRNPDIGNHSFQLATSRTGSVVALTSDAGSGNNLAVVELDSLHVAARHDGALGLPRRNTSGYWEYRPTYLEIGFDAAGAKLLKIGEGDGAGSGLVRIDTGLDQVNVRVVQTSGGTERGVPAALLVGSHIATDFVQVDGDTGVAVFPSETASINNLEVRAGIFYGGEGLTLTGDVLAAVGALHGQYIDAAGKRHRLE